VIGSSGENWVYEWDETSGSDLLSFLISKESFLGTQSPPDACKSTSRSPDHPMIRSPDFYYHFTERFIRFQAMVCLADLRHMELAVDVGMQDSTGKQRHYL
jgi:hypothetical protein